MIRVKEKKIQFNTPTIYQEEYDILQVKFDDPIDNSSLYIAGSKLLGTESEVVFYSDTYTVGTDGVITFTLNTYNYNYLNYIKKVKDEIFLEIGQVGQDKRVYLFDKCFANPRVYIDGVVPTDIVPVYSKDEADAKFLSILSAAQLYYTKDEADARFLSGDLNDYLPLSGGNVGHLSINNVNVIPSSYALKSDLNSYLPISGGAFEGEVEMPSATVSSLIQNGVDYDLSKMAEDCTLSSFTSTTLTPTSNIFYHSASPLASLTLTIPTGVRNTFIFFETGPTFSATITLDSSLFVNEEMMFEENKAYLIAIERDCVLWTEMIK